ncbi:efflux RND transporter periplasmic adaptor subunit [Methylobacterium radiodurans]|uniref:Efflux RND transporter periplasmic adaptor subunit n=1 Tax=Methylobacterium radiodurans TaxID=2202828 RepID=A0A2U8VYY0_9HYPH|nr:efflux RND transporter periplasmic adaptor subunit [Methylobacterium radiodurans]
MRRSVRNLLIGLAVLAAAGGGWYAAGRPVPAPVAGLLGTGDRPAAERKDDKPLGVSMAEAVSDSVPIAFTYTGTFVSPKDALLQARVTGVVTERPFEPGSHVKKGDVLFRIDKRPFEVALQTAKAQQEQAKAQLEFAQAEVARTNELASKGYASEQRAQQQQSQLETAAAGLQQAEAAIARQELNIAYAVVEAPFEGRASLSNVNVGDLVNENQTELVSVVQLDPIDLQMALSSEDVEAVRQGLKEGTVTVGVLDGRGTKVADARIYQLDNRFDPRTARRLVRASVANADERFVPGQFMRGRIQVGTQSRILVPTVALSAKLAQRIVYVVGKNGRVEQRPVETGQAYGERTEILKGLEAGERVVTDHIQRMRDGLRVEERRAVAGNEASTGIKGRPVQ